METGGPLAILVMLEFTLLEPGSTEGCSPVPSLSLTLFPGDRRPSNHSALKCQLCPDKNANAWQEHTFAYFLNGNLKHLMKRRDTSSLYTPSRTTNFYGLWQCRVEEYPHLTADYFLPPPASHPPTTEQEAGNQERSTPVPPRLVVTIVTAAVLLIILIIVTAITSSCCLITYYRKRSTLGRHVREREKSEESSSCPENTNLSGSAINMDPVSGPESCPEVSYVELDIPQKPPPPKNYPRSPDTIYANIM